MSGEVRAFLYQIPGETRGLVVRDSRPHHLIIQREGDPPRSRLGARLVGRVARREPAFAAAFIDLGGAGLQGFLPLRGGGPAEGQAVEVEVAAEPRDGKGPALRLLGPAEGLPRLLEPGPTVEARLRTLAPDAPPQGGLEAMRNVIEAEDEALARVHVFAGEGVDMAVERTRAMVTVDIDFTGRPGRDARRARARANLFALGQAARLVCLKGWGGLVGVDLAGTGHDGQAVLAAARTAFAGVGTAFGPISRFGLLQLSLPWGARPIEEILLDIDRRPSLVTRVMALVRALRMAELSDPATPRWCCLCNPEEAALLAPLAARLGPRFSVRPVSGLAPGGGSVEEG